MNSRTLSTISIIGFLLLGGVLMGLRYYRLDQMEIGAAKWHRWELTYKINFEAVVVPGPQESR